MGTQNSCTCGPADGDIPEPFLKVIHDVEDPTPRMIGLHAGFELSTWRASALANHIMDWVLDFALRPEEREYLAPGRARATMKRAIRATFGNGNDRGLPGEILLHAICRQLYGSSTVLNKIYFKTADNDTYKGFDSVHCVHTVDGNLELWLGEAKFYRSAKRAIDRVIADFDTHLEADYLHTEFAIVSQKISASHPHAEDLRKLMHPNTSLDEVFDRLVIPVFITYDSKVTNAHSKDCPEFFDEIRDELDALHDKVTSAFGDDLPVSVRVFFLPLADKAGLLQALEKELAPWK
ncbi:DUF1837 domain-containing protein [Microbacterium oxydans]|nr:DUF1837 domain-containing protein [Microbacterium oxydans]